MKIHDLKIECDDGTAVRVWCDCRSQDDIDEVIAWLRLAKGLMGQWEKIHAKAARKAQAPAGQNEDHQQGEIQRAASQ